jgi:hypothetical protein
MILDAQLAFTSTAGQAITASAVSTNSIDLGPTGRDFAVLDYPAPLIVADVLTAFSSGTPTATLTINLQAAPDNGGVAGTFTTIDASPALPLGQLTAGNRPYKQSMTVLSELLAPAQTIFGTFSCSSGATTITVASATSLVAGMFIASSGILVPGTQIVSISGSTVTVSTATMASAVAGTTFAATSALGTGSAATKLPRFLQLQFSVSATMTAGTLFCGIVLDLDKMPLYPAGFVIPAGVAA